MDQEDNKAFDCDKTLLSNGIKQRQADFFNLVLRNTGSFVTKCLMSRALIYFLSYVESKFIFR